MRWVLCKGKVFYDEGGRPAKMLGLNIDITARKQAEEALRLSEARLAFTEDFSDVAIDSLPGIFYLYDSEGRFLRWNKNLEEVSGYTGEEIARMHPLDFFSGEEKLLVERRIAEVFAEGESSVEAKLVAKNGHETHYFFTGKLVNFNQVSCLVGMGINIEGRLAAERALVDSNERNRAMLRALPDLVFLNGRDGVYIDYYARDPRTLLVPPEAFLGKTMRDVLPSELAERFMDCIALLHGSDETHVVEYSLSIAGEERHFEARLAAADGEKILSIIRDVTEQHRAAEALRLSEERLFQTNRQIRALAGRLISAQESERRRISLQLHDDLSQNIATLALSISRLKRKLPASREQIVVELEGFAQNTNDLAMQVRRLSHQLHPEALEHLGLVAALKWQATEFGNEERIDLTFTARVSNRRIPFDLSVCLYRVALEALRNVSIHSGARSARVSLIEDEDSLMLEVSDTGRGFDVESAKRGSGLGLISAEERVMLLHGTLEITSVPQEGTLLRARIPLERSS
jgi:PAS domain S-box-containing protein